MLTAAFRFYCYDMSAIFLLALVISLRSCVAGLQVISAMLTGMFAASIWPIARELFLVGTVKHVFSNTSIQAALFFGAILGIALSKLFIRDKILIWTQIISLAFLATFGFLCCVQHVQILAAILMSMFLCILPDFISDLIMGDAARFVSESRLITRTMSGVILAAFVYVFVPPLGVTLPIDLLALPLGIIFPLLLQIFRPK